MKLYNTLTKKVEQIEPITPGAIKLYSCGPTVYDYTHIGNWFSFIRWDILNRVLNQHYSVYWVMNITDVGHLVSDDDAGEDKLEKGARRENKTAWQIADYYGNYFLDALARLNFSKVTIIPKATEHIKEQIELVEKLESKGFAYVIKDGVYFDTSKLADYGKLTHFKNQQLLEGARVEPAPGKKNITDFALWKFSPKDKKRDMEWDSPWGKGFPGWHIECSAMSMKYLGETLDIHCGGIDLIPVHHTNEIAQSESASGKPFAKYWVHSNFVKVDGKKMSKSLGNLYTLEDIEQKGYSLQAFRLLVLESHYRNESQFTWEVLEAASNRLKRWQQVADLIWQSVGFTDKKAESVRADKNTAIAKAERLLVEMLKALEDDLNTPQAIKLIDEMMDLVENQGMSHNLVKPFENIVAKIDELLGVKLQSKDIGQEVKSLLLERQKARESKDWQKSDDLRDRIIALGYGVKDTNYGQQWYRI
jgi:cysteinyl-tRNA synthetase